MSIGFKDDCCFQVFNVHIPPQWTSTQKREIIDLIKFYSLNDDAALIFIVGDLNFGDTRCDGTTDDNRFLNDPQQTFIRNYFENKFTGFTDYNNPKLLILAAIHFPDLIIFTLVLAF